MTGPRGEGLMTIAEVADATTIDTPTLYAWRRTEKGPRPFRLGSEIVYRRADVRAWIAAHRAGAA
jgi:predicted DNA-binding transcriptional regulator AlpA